MNALRLVCAFAALASCHGGIAYSGASLLSPHVALPHANRYDSVGVSQVPVAPLFNHASGVLVKSHGFPVAASHHVAPALHKTVSVSHAAPVAHAVPVAHAAPVAVTTKTVSHSHGLPVAVSHGAHLSHAAPVAVAHAAPVAVSHGAHVAHAAPVAVTTKTVSHSHAPVAVAHAAPVAVAHAAPVAVSHGAHVAPIATEVKSQFHVQDELGQYSFGYRNADSAREETRDAYGRVRGSFSYVDPYGTVQAQRYVADEGGFRVEGTNLPRHKRSYSTYPASTGPLAVAHAVTPVVHAAPAVHAVHAVHASPALHAVHAAPAVHHGSLPYSGSYGYSAPVRGYSYSYQSVPSVRTYSNLPFVAHRGHY